MIMKRLFLTVLAVLSMTMTFAEDEKLDNVSSTNAYDMRINYKPLARSLQLSKDQTEAMIDAHEAFCADMMSVAAANKEARKAMMGNAITKNLRNMHYILDKDQYRLYLRILNTTINNRGLNK